MEVSIYCCYSLDLKKYLEKRGIRYKLVAANPNNHRLFWAYIRDEKLDTVLKEWSTK